MENKIQVFSNDEFGKIRVLMMVRRKNVATKLDYSNPRDAISKHVDSKSIYTGFRRKFHLSKIK